MFSSMITLPLAALTWAISACFCIMFRNPYLTQCKSHFVAALAHKPVVVDEKAAFVALPMLEPTP